MWSTSPSISPPSASALHDDVVDRLAAAGSELRAVDLSDRTVRSIVTAAAWIAVVLVVRFAMRAAFAAWERRNAENDATAVARRRTTFSFLVRIVVALVALIGIWSVLSIYPQTSEVGRAM